MSIEKGELTMRVMVVINLIFLICLVYLIFHTLLEINKSQGDFYTWFKNNISLEYEDRPPQN